MLNNISKLFFPKIVFEKSVEILHTNNNDTNKIINLYYLDWARKEKKCSKSGEPELSFEYEQLLKSFRFAITDSYLREIRRTSWLAVGELNVNRGIDTSMKKIYMLPAVSYIDTAFKLLSDCVFDVKTGFYYRGEYRIILPHLLLYKFWINQASTSFLLEFVKIPDLITLSVSDNMPSDFSEKVNEFLTFVNSNIDSK